MKGSYRFLFFLHAFVGLGAIGGGLAAILTPLEPLGVSTELLSNSPFNNYLIRNYFIYYNWPWEYNQCCDNSLQVKISRIYKQCF